VAKKMGISPHRQLVARSHSVALERPPRCPLRQIRPLTFPTYTICLTLPNLARNRKKNLLAFQDKLATIKIFDPACGSGNFLTESYLSLRRLENEILKELFGSQIQLGEFVNPIKVSIGQFYGVEINDFAVAVAQTALWIAELQMIQETQQIIHHDLDFLPLKSYANIIEGNALQIDWRNLFTIPNS
ncbi:MAG: hypothetical protein IJQ85_09105, partial [Selenomonadaceae bacterium]|nr:hypothetical protein [Selenomonadaceae bacterium]